MSSVDVTNELRLAKPRAPEQLRERVMALSERPVREPRFSFSLPSRYTARRLALVAVPAVVAVAVGGAVIHGIANSGAPQPEVARGRLAQPTNTVPVFDAATPRVTATVPFGSRSLEKAPLPSLRALPPNLTRLQHYQAALTVRVDGLDALSPSTQKAMRIARALGGYVVSANFNAAKEGASALVFKIPVGHVQQAIAKFSALGTIAAQNIQITDLQVQFNRVVKQIGATRVAIAKIDDRLADTSLSNEERVRLEQRRARLAATARGAQDEPRAHRAPRRARHRLPWADHERGGRGRQAGAPRPARPRAPRRRKHPAKGGFVGAVRADRPRPDPADRACCLPPRPGRTSRCRPPPA